ALTATAAYQKGPLWWAAHHRHHHIHTDTVSDLHSPLTRSFWRAHIGWFLSCESKLANHNLVTSLTKYRDLRFLDRYYSLPPILLALATFLLGVLLDQYFPGLQTSGWQMLAWGFFVSTVLLYHGTFTVNSIAHLFGTRRYKTKDNSRNNFLIALITLGEGWHNNHHHYPSSERQGFFWWEIDLTHYTLRMLSYLGVVWDLREPPLKLFTKD
ncbi:MAG TPA: fatty acid desaturase, partial [Blastocatellia bacterium]|nr:fatty acid desaturase [Blastocatellia bacterium]